LDYKTILVADDGPIRTITFNRPERRNAMTPEMQMELIAAFEQTATSLCRVVVLSGGGESFCSGLDLSSLAMADGQSAADHLADAERVARLFLSLRELPMPTLAAVDGAAIAGGCGLALISDFTLATPRAKFGFTEVRIGFVPALVSAFLALDLGDKQSRDLLLTGRILDAEEALRLGLVNAIVPHQELAERVRRLAETLIANSPQSLAATKRLMGEQRKAWLDAAIIAAIECHAQVRQFTDFREGVQAFLAKRKPVWGR
jgi:methylglutaconyl-CoA hydratase